MCANGLMDAFLDPLKLCVFTGISIRSALGERVHLSGHSEKYATKKLGQNFLIAPTEFEHRGVRGLTNLTSLT